MSRVGRFLFEELKLVVPPTIYFFCAFNIIALTSNLLVRHYWFAMSNFLLATTMALVVGKVILVAHRLTFLDSFRAAPLAWPILFKTAFYSVVVGLIRLLEVFIHIVTDDRGFHVAVRAVLDVFTWQHFAMVQIWLFLTFLVYVTVRELSALSGKSFLALLFQPRPAGAIP